MLPGKYQPTKTHWFLQLLLRKGILKRVYTQNIDTLEKLAELPDEKVVYAHGSYSDVHCIKCGKQVGLEKWRADIEADVIPRCQATVFRLLDDEEEPSDEGAAPDNISTKVNETTNETERFVSEPCHGLVKPDIVFFGEDLPERFHKMRKQDFQAADCLLVLGTSLQVAPFNYSILLGGKSIPRVLINNEKVGTVEDMRHPEGFRFDDKRNFRDLFLEGNCDDIVAEMCTELGWEKELEALERGAANRNGWELMVKNQAREEDRVAVARRGGD